MNLASLDWKKALAKILQELKIIDREFHGKVEIDINSGGVASARRIENLK